MDSIKGGTALVTGGGSGLGRETAQRFADAGARVLVVDVDAEGASETVGSIREAGGEAVSFEADVSSEEDAEAMVEAAYQEFSSLDFVYNNAGIEGPKALAADETIEDWDHILDVNLKGVFLGMKFQIPRMLEDGGGAIVNTSSIAGRVGFAEQPAYTASKHGVIGLTKAAALAYSDQGMRINAICPGAIDTPMQRRSESEEEIAQMEEVKPIGRLGQPREIADAVIWLCSEQASYVTGTALDVDGGYTAQ